MKAKKQPQNWIRIRSADQKQLQKWLDAGFVVVLTSGPEHIPDDAKMWPLKLVK